MKESMENLSIMSIKPTFSDFEWWQDDDGNSDSDSHIQFSQHEPSLCHWQHYLGLLDHEQLIQSTQAWQAGQPWWFSIQQSNWQGRPLRVHPTNTLRIRAEERIDKRTVNWKACRSLIVSSTERPTGMSLTVICLAQHLVFLYHNVRRQANSP